MGWKKALKRGADSEKLRERGNLPRIGPARKGKAESERRQCDISPAATEKWITKMRGRGPTLLMGK